MATSEYPHVLWFGFRAPYNIADPRLSSSTSYQWCSARSRVKVSQLNLIDLVTKVYDFHMESTALTYTVWNERLYLYLGPDGSHSDRPNGQQYNVVVEDGLLIADYVSFWGQTPYEPGEHLVLASANDDRFIGSNVVVDDGQEGGIHETLQEDLADSEGTIEEEEECCPDCRIECLERRLDIASIVPPR
jgi:hypothetical protein